MPTHITMLFCAAFAGPLMAAGPKAKLKPVFPGKRWQRRSPAQVGLDAAKLKVFQKLVGGRGCITRHGYLVHTCGAYDKPHDVASAVKPFYSFLLLKAVASL